MEVIGEKINTTRKSVEKAVRERDAPFIQDLARRQAEAGANYLDVNSGLALYPEEEAEDLAWLVSTIQEAVGLPLCIDSGRLQPIEAALKLHKGTAIINSVDGDPAKLGGILPLAARYGCKVIALTSSKEEGIPQTCAGRVKIAERIAGEAQKEGIALENIYFDPLVLPVATNHKSALLFMDTLKEIKGALNGAKIVSGLSNISFGLPRRKLLNHAFLILCLGCGMDAAIVDPTDKAVMAMIQAAETLMGKDAYCAQYLMSYRGGKLDI